VSKTSPLQKFAKTDLRYWRDVVFRPKTSQAGREVSQFYVKIQYQGRRETFQLKTNNQEVAADKAKSIYLGLVAKGWETILNEQKPNRRSQTMEVQTVGDLINAALKRNDIARRTLMDYSRALRLIVAQILGFGGAARTSSRGDLKSRRLRIEQTKLGNIAPKDVEQWRQRFLGNAAAKGPVVLRRAKNSLNSTLRQAKSLFSPRFLRHLNSGKEIPNPFVGVNFEPRQSMRYHSQIDLDQLIKAALHGKEDAKLEPLPTEQLKVFLLAGLAGLRRNEIDKLEWDSFRWKDNIIQLKTTDFFRPKTEESLGDVSVDIELITLFKGFFARSKSPFVIEAAATARVNTAYSSYRCQAVFDALTQWLKKAGVTSRTPLHTLRKEFGSLMCSKYGIYAASRALRHRDIYITSQHYVDTKQRFVPGLSAQLDICN
jgi:hypothetical protein